MGLKDKLSGAFNSTYFLSEIEHASFISLHLCILGKPENCLFYSQNLEDNHVLFPLSWFILFYVFRVAFHYIFMWTFFKLFIVVGI